VHDLERLVAHYRGTLLIRNNPSLGRYSRPMPGALWRSYTVGGGIVSYKPGTPVCPPTETVSVQDLQGCLTPNP